jgi:TonB-linked SusC/RagA family outer membrane protein
MIKNYSILLLLLVSLIGAGPLTANPKLVRSMAQSISGRIVDETGQPVPGVNILEKGTSNGTTSDADGAYKITVEGESSVLIFTFIGYAPQETSVGAQNTINVTLVPDIKSLDEIVVTALGIKKESKKLGYATATVGVDQIQQNRTVNVMTSLVGKVSGLDISPPAAGSGASTKIRLRGQTGFSGSNNAPLIVVNGLPMDQGAQGADGNNSRDRGDALQSFNPDDIESITVLKGVGATALYGSRAANGAVIITTKSGQKSQGLGVEYTTNYTVGKMLDFTDLQQEYGQGTWVPALGTGVRPATQGEATSTGQLGWGAKLDGTPQINFDGISRPYSAHPNNFKDFYRDATNFTNTVAVSGGNDKGSFRASFSDVSTKGITPNNEYKKKIGNLGINYNLSERLKFSFNGNFSNEENLNPPQVGIQGPGEANFIYRMSTSIPMSAYKQSVLAANGITELPTSGFFGTTLINPYFSMPRAFWKENRNRLLSTTSLRYDLAKWLYVQGRFNYQYFNSLNEFNLPTGQATTTPYNATNVEFNGNFTSNTNDGYDMNADFLLGANKQFGDFSVDVTLGANTLRQETRFTNQTVTDFIVFGIYSLGNGVTSTTNNSGINWRQRINSWYGAAEIGYKGMVYVNFTDRQDWFSTLNVNNNTKNYPSVSGSFIFSEVLESQKWLSYGKVRASWAQGASSSGSGYAENNLTYSVLATPYNGQKLGNINTGNAPNPLLRPATTTEKEVGVELKLFNRKINFDVAAYEKVTTDQIITVALTNSSGYTGTKQNFGKLQNRGMEFFIEGTPFESAGFRWVSSFNAAHNKTKVLAIAPGINRIPQTTFGGNEFIGFLVYEVGQPINQLSAKTYLRDANGNILVGNNGRLLASADNVNFGSGLPTWTGGWNNTFSYKKLSLLVQFDFKGGGKILSSSALNWLRQGHSKESLVGREGGVIFDALRQSDGQPNTTAANPQTFYTDYRSLQIADPFIYKNDFIKLRNITLTYDFTSLVSTKLNFIKGLVLSAACRNVWLIHKDLANLDPEAFASTGDNRTGYEGTSLPTTRDYSLNLNVRF